MAREPCLSPRDVLMDKLHRELFDEIDKLSAAPDHAFCDGYKTLVAQFERSFLQEEQWMDEIDFPELGIHQEMHARALGALHRAYGRILGGDLQIGREVVEKLLPQWFAFHVSAMDAPLGAALQSARPGEDYRECSNFTSSSPPLSR